MSIGSIGFFVFSAVAFVLWALTQKTRRNVVLLFINGGFIVLACGFDPLVAPVLAFVVIGYGAVCIAAQRLAGTLPYIIVMVVFIFIFMNDYSNLSISNIFGMNFVLIGLSYILFRVIHLCVDIHNSSTIQRPSFTQYLNYVLFFLTFTSGPIMKHQDYQVSISTAAVPTDDSTIRAAVGRVLLGLVKVTVVASVAHAVFLAFPVTLGTLSGAGGGSLTMLPGPIQSFVGTLGFDSESLRSAARFAIACFAYLIFLYYNFSGYMDIVIGVGRLFGFQIAENFNRPFTATNFLDFWSRWHMTLSGWFKVYVFKSAFEVPGRTVRAGPCQRLRNTCILCDVPGDGVLARNNSRLFRLWHFARVQLGWKQSLSARHVASFGEGASQTPQREPDLCHGLPRAGDDLLLDFVDVPVAVDR
jgi:alginate O-acetyltransferase complex protein AlgI